MYKSKKIVIVDDEKMVTSTLKTLLALEGFTDTHFFNVPKEAVEFLKENKPDLIISDFVMPEMNGLEFLKEAKALYPDTCMILMTGYADKENAVRAINEVGLYKYIEKPWDNDDLIINIRNGIERSNLVQSLKEKITELNSANAKLERYSLHLEDMVKARTAELLEANAKLNAVISNCADGIILISKDKKVDGLNSAMETMFGLSESMVKAMSLDELFETDGEPFTKKFEKFEVSGMVHDIVYVISFEVVKDGYRYRAVGECGKKYDAPSRTVSPAQCNFVAGFDARSVEEQVEHGDIVCHILVFECLAVVIGQRVEAPIVKDALTNQ